MFNGIVETTGMLAEINLHNGCKEFLIVPKLDLNPLKIGESIAVNGTCLSVTQVLPDAFSVTVVPETLRLTNLDALTVHDEVNLERAMLLQSRIHGHLLQGHIDASGQILAISNDAQSEALLLKISLPKTLQRYVVKKGFIAIDGMSITIVDVAENDFTITLIPLTQEITRAKKLSHW